MKRLLPCLLLPAALAACNATGDPEPAVGVSPLAPPGSTADVTGFTVLGQDGSINAIWSYAGGSSWTASSPTGERITAQETGRSDCCISFATSSSAVADVRAMEFRLTTSGVSVPIVDVVRR